MSIASVTSRKATAILHFTIIDPAELSQADITMLRDRGVTPKIFMRGMGLSSATRIT
jgi:hypothetical protein